MHVICQTVIHVAVALRPYHENGAVVLFIQCEPWFACWKFCL